MGERRREMREKKMFSEMKKEKNENGKMFFW